MIQRSRLFYFIPLKEKGIRDRRNGIRALSETDLSQPKDEPIPLTSSDNFFVWMLLFSAIKFRRSIGQFWVLYSGALLCTCCDITFAAVSKPDDRSYQTQKVARHIKSKNHQNCLLYPKSASYENFFVSQLMIKSDLAQSTPQRHQSGR